MRKRPVIVARPWETSLKLSRTLHSSALRSTWTARWGPADDLPLIGSAVCMSARGPNAKSGSVRLCAACGSRFMSTCPSYAGRLILGADLNCSESGPVPPEAHATGLRCDPHLGIRKDGRERSAAAVRERIRPALAIVCDESPDGHRLHRMVDDAYRAVVNAGRDAEQNHTVLCA